jgi:RNA polymerase sigma factor (sigma-70 family)
MTTQTHRLPENDNFEAFKTQYYAILENPGHPIWLFIYRNSKQLQLGGIEPHEVLSEVWLRGIEAIKAGTTINNPGAWIRAVSYNILVQEVRRLKKEKRASVSFDSIESRFLVESGSSENDETEPDYLLLRQAVHDLKQEDQKIITLRYFQGLSWEEIRETLLSEGIEVKSVAVLRKRGQRAIERLRSKYLPSN